MTTSKLIKGGKFGVSQKATLVGGSYMIKYEKRPAVRPCQGTDVIAGALTKIRYCQQSVQVQIDAVGVLKAEQAIVLAVNMKACLVRFRRK